MWKSNQHTIRINNKHGTSTNPIIIKANSTDGHVLKGDAANIFQIRTSTHFIIEDLNIVGLVDSIPLEDAWLHRFDYKIDGDDTVYQREDPNATSAEIEGKTYPDISNLNVFRPTLFTTNGLLVQSSRYITVRNCQVGYAPGTGLRVQSSDFVNVENNKVHNSSRRSSVGNHGMVIHSVTNNVGGDVVSDDGYRINITGNEVYDNYNEVYSWSELKTFITPHIDEGKGITIQKTDASFDNGSGRILIANNVVYGNGFSGVHTNYATKVDILHNTAVENTRTGKGVNTGISVSDSSNVNVINNVAYSTNDFGGNVYSTDMDDLAASQIIFASNIAVGNLSNRLDSNDFFVSTDGALLLQSSAPYRLASGSPAENVGDASTLSIVPLDKDGTARSNPPDLGAYEIQLGTPTPSSMSVSPSAPPTTETIVSVSPSESPSSTSNSPTANICFDSSLKIRMKIRKRKFAWKNCTWVAQNPNKCQSLGVAKSCPSACGTCDVCADSPYKFRLVRKNGRKNLVKCSWVKKKRNNRCSLVGVSDICRSTCGMC